MGPWERILCPSIIIKHFFTSLGLSERLFHPWIVSLLHKRLAAVPSLNLSCWLYIHQPPLDIVWGDTLTKPVLPGIKERLIWWHVTALSHHPATPWRGRPLNLHLNCSNLRRTHPTHPMPRPYLRVLPSYFLTYQDEHILGHHHIHIVYPSVFR